MIQVELERIHRSAQEPGRPQHPVEVFSFDPNRRIITHPFPLVLDPALTLTQAFNPIWPTRRITRKSLIQQLILILANWRK